MRSTLASCALAALLVAVAWADHHHHHHHDHDHDHSHGEGYACHVLSDANADFAFAMYKNLNAKTPAGKNIFYSPIGISAALSMVSMGAAGETESQIISTLGYSAFNQTQIGEGYEHFFHMIGHNQESRQLEVGNSVAVRPGFTPLEAFVNNVKHFYSGEFFNADFAKPEEAAAEINRHIALKTHDKIKDMVKDLDPSMVMVLINYVYFRGQWEHVFDANATQKEDFHVDEATTVQVDMMKRMGRYDIHVDNDNHATIVRLPYKGNASMIVVLPKEGKMKEVEDRMTKEHIAQWHSSFFKNNVNIFMPKFSISADASLDETLKEMGVTHAFSDTADFSGMSDGGKVKISKVSHKAVLSVDETGTEAAASTTIEIMPMSMPENVRLDRPFLVFILDNETKSILFMGKISNPMAM